MRKLTSEQKFLLALRLCLAWVFLYAASHQVLVKGWSIAGFLNSTKTFHWFYGAIAHSSLVPLLTFCRYYRGMGGSAHATGVWAGMALANTLMIWACPHG
mgnify:CR=1 FL=1